MYAWQVPWQVSDKSHELTPAAHAPSVTSGVLRITPKEINEEKEGWITFTVHCSFCTPSLRGIAITLLQFITSKLGALDVVHQSHRNTTQPRRFLFRARFIRPKFPSLRYRARCQSSRGSSGTATIEAVLSWSHGLQPKSNWEQIRRHVNHHVQEVMVWPNHVGRTGVGWDGLAERNITIIRASASIATERASEYGPQCGSTAGHCPHSELDVLAAVGVDQPCGAVWLHQQAASENEIRETSNEAPKSCWALSDSFTYMLTRYAGKDKDVLVGKMDGLALILSYISSSGAITLSLLG
ncbi:hypothetical protein C8J57DRAFT_1679111 [Mycena rebaudengoi]|nr:hypothetical protein C8J57DRAFT_1679111 [Mycena rebaudengoi]